MARPADHKLATFFLCLGAALSGTGALAQESTASATPGLAQQAAPAPQSKSKWPRLGLKAEYVRLLDKDTRNFFGDEGLSIGPKIGGVRPGREGKWGADLGLQRDERTIAGQKNKYLVVFAGADYTRAFARTDEAYQKPLQPYYGAGAGLVYTDIKAPTLGLDSSGLGLGGTLFTGLAYKENAFLEARLRATTSRNNFNFSSIGISAGVLF